MPSKQKVRSTRVTFPYVLKDFKAQLKPNSWLYPMVDPLNLPIYNTQKDWKEPMGNGVAGFSVLST